jgi:hypothetical protein
MESKTLFHGSGTLIKGKLAPRPSKVVNNKKVVFATPHRWMALVFASGARSEDLDIGFVNGQGYISEMYENAFHVLNKGGYLYSVSSEGFRTDGRLMGGNHEFINFDPVPILKTEYVANILSELLKMSKVSVLPDSASVQKPI